MIILLKILRLFYVPLLNGNVIMFVANLMGQHMPWPKRLVNVSLRKPKSLKSQGLSVILFCWNSLLLFEVYSMIMNSFSKKTKNKKKKSKNLGKSYK
jgi:hypothetical protein